MSVCTYIYIYIYIYIYMLKHVYIQQSICICIIYTYVNVYAYNTTSPASLERKASSGDTACICGDVGRRLVVSTWEGLGGVGRGWARVFWESRSAVKLAECEAGHGARKPEGVLPARKAL